MIFSVWMGTSLQPSLMQVFFQMENNISILSDISPHEPGSIAN